MSTEDVRRRVAELLIERHDHASGAHLADIERELDACRSAYVGLAATEIASFRAQLSGPQVG